MIQCSDEDIPQEALICLWLTISAMVNNYIMWPPGYIYSSAFLK